MVRLQQLFTDCFRNDFAAGPIIPVNSEDDLSSDWEKLVKKALRKKKHDDVSATQDESETRSFVFNRKPGTKHDDDDVSSTQDESETSSSVFNWKPETTSDEEVVVSFTPIRTIPFLLLNEQLARRRERSEKPSKDDENENLVSGPQQGSVEKVQVSTDLTPRHLSAVPKEITVCHGTTIKGMGRTEIMDPTDPLLFGSLDAVSSDLAAVADLLFLLLQKHTEGLDDDESEQQMLDCIRDYPETCQVRFIFEGMFWYPLALFSRTGNLRLVEAAYQAFPEAVGCDLGHGSPLHFAKSLEITMFLLRVFPEGARKPNKQLQTPLHVACIAKELNVDVLRLLLDVYPAALHISDDKGWTPLHNLCANRQATTSALELVLASPMGIGAVTMDLQRPLHIAAASKGDLSILKYLYDEDPGQVRYIDEEFQLPLHKAVTLHCQTGLYLDHVRWLVAIFPAALHFADMNDERPLDLAQRLVGDPVLCELLQPSSRSGP